MLELPAPVLELPAMLLELPALLLELPALLLELPALLLEGILTETQGDYWMSANVRDVLGVLGGLCIC